MPGAFGVRVIYMKPIVPYAVCTLCLLTGTKPHALNIVLSKVWLQRRLIGVKGGWLVG